MITPSGDSGTPSSVALQKTASLPMPPKKGGIWVNPMSPPGCNAIPNWSDPLPGSDHPLVELNRARALSRAKENRTFHSESAGMCQPAGHRPCRGAAPTSCLQSVVSQVSGNAIAVDQAGNAFITGSAFAWDFPLTAGSWKDHVSYYPLSSIYALRPAEGGFVTKLNTTGTALLYSTLIDEPAMGLAVGSTGAAYIAGRSQPYLPAVTQFTLAIGDPALGGGTVVTRLTPDGSLADLTVFLGCLNPDLIHGGVIALDSANNILVGGSTTCATFPSGTTGVFQPAHAHTSSNAYGSGDDGLIVKIAADASSVLAATFLGGGDRDEIGQASEWRVAPVLDTGTNVKKLGHDGAVVDRVRAHGIERPAAGSIGLDDSEVGRWIKIQDGRRVVQRNQVPHRGFIAENVLRTEGNAGINGEAGKLRGIEELPVSSVGPLDQVDLEVDIAVGDYRNDR